MFCDYHIHTDFSCDSTYLMEDVVKDAIEMGLEEVCFCEHVDYGVKVDWKPEEPRIKTFENMRNAPYEDYFQEIARLQHLYGNQIRIRRGLEMGVQTHTIEEHHRVFTKYPLDFVILSIHQVQDKEFWNNAFQEGRSEAEYYEGYYQEMYDVVRNYHDYSVLGHMDMIKRYDGHDGYDAFHEHYDLISNILKYVIEDGKGIELNTSSIAYGLDDLMPSRAILKRYYELGGRILTIGSDTHKKEHLGAHIQELKQELKAIGFTQFCTFEDMVPSFHDL